MKDVSESRMKNRTEGQPNVNMKVKKATSCSLKSPGGHEPPQPPPPGPLLVCCTVLWFISTLVLKLSYTIWLIIPSASFLAGIFLLFLSKKRKDENKRDQEEENNS